jgi:ABC-type transport system involved in multi-copper enzyme maturation permease subunit
MNGKQVTSRKRMQASGSRRPAWRVIFSWELKELWIGGKALILIILFSILLSIMAWLLATNSELNLIPPKEMIFLTLQTCIAVGLFISLIIGADSISGERERATFEGLLLTPASRRQIILGKFLAAISPWPVAFAITVPYLILLSQGDGNVVMNSVLWGLILGSILVLAFTGFAMLVSIGTNSNRTSLFVSLAIYILCLLPTQFPGPAQAGFAGQFIKKINPMEATNQFLEKVIVNNRTPQEMAIWLWAPILFFGFVLVILFWYASSVLSFDAGRIWMRRPARSRAALLSLAVCLMIVLGTTPVMALGRQPFDIGTPLNISIDTAYKTIKTGDTVDFNTTVINNGGEDSPQMFVAMNIINLAKDGDPVDPEDWSPERTQAIPPLAVGQSATQSWSIHAILDGNYMVYMVLVPEPTSPQSTSQPVVSTGIHMTVTPFASLNPGGVLPLALGMPIGLTLLMFVLLWNRNRSINIGRSSSTVENFST